MNDKIRRNDLCPCGSGKKYKKCCMLSDSLPSISWMDKNGIHFVSAGKEQSIEKLEEMTKEYQKSIRNSPIWDVMVKEYGEDRAEELLKEFKVELK